MAFSSIHITQGLLIPVINGKVAAVRELYYQLKGKIFAYAYKHTKSRETATEIVQDISVKLWQARAGIDLTGSFEAYVMRMTQNHLLKRMRDVAKHEQKRTQLLERLEYIQENPEADFFAKESY